MPYIILKTLVISLLLMHNNGSPHTAHISENIIQVEAVQHTEWPAYSHSLIPNNYL